MAPVVKERPDAPPGFFQAEAAGLRWLAEAEGARVARVLDVAPGRIVVERIPAGRADAGVAAAFGRALAATHDAGAEAFGAKPRGWTGPVFIGRLEQACRPEPSWGAFYAEQRVRPFVRGAVSAGNLASDQAALVEHACDLVASGMFDDEEPAARIHGDLWNGNVLWGPDGAVLIDPAAHGGHRETDLAMLALFGCPFLEVVLAGYEDAHRLVDGWRDRVPLHQLHPLAVHAVGHGPAYGAALVEAARRTLALV